MDSASLEPSWSLAAVGDKLIVVAGTYRLANFACCQETHCIVTGPGWSALAIAGVGAR